MLLLSLAQLMPFIKKAQQQELFVSCTWKSSCPCEIAKLARHLAQPSFPQKRETFVNWNSFLEPRTLGSQKGLPSLSAPRNVISLQVIIWISVKHTVIALLPNTCLPTTGHTFSSFVFPLELAQIAFPYIVGIKFCREEKEVNVSLQYIAQYVKTKLQMWGFWIFKSIFHICMGTEYVYVYMYMCVFMCLQVHVCLCVQARVQTWVSFSGCYPQEWDSVELELQVWLWPAEMRVKKQPQTLSRNSASFDASLSSLHLTGFILLLLFRFWEWVSQLAWSQSNRLDCLANDSQGFPASTSPTLGIAWIVFHVLLFSVPSGYQTQVLKLAGQTLTDQACFPAAPSKGF